MFDWQLHHQLLEDMVFAGLHVDVLPISRLFFVQRLLNEELDCLMEFSSELLSCVAGTGTVASTGSGKCSQSTCF
jgi:hypothetical protein